MSDLVKRMTMISDDMRKDAADFDGKPFDGKTVGTYFGCQGAAIAALAETIKEMLLERESRVDTDSAV